MRTINLALACGLTLVACGNSPDPRVIAGGGIGDGEIDGDLNVYVIDNATYKPIVDATVEVGGKQGTTDSAGLVSYHDLSGAQDISTKANGYRSAVWRSANGANVTIPLTLLGALTPQKANISGSITGWSAITVPTGHLKAAYVLYSQNDNLDDAANNIPTDNMMNLCGVTGTTCDFTVTSRTGTVTLAAVIIDRDFKGTVDATDDTVQIIGWATAPSIQVDAGVNQSGIVLTQVDAGNLQNVTLDLGSPPAALTKTTALVGVEISKDEVVQLPVFIQTDISTVLVPKPVTFAANATYRFTAIAQTTMGDTGPQSFVLKRGQKTTALVADRWLDPPANVAASRTNASFDVVANAEAHSVQWSDSTGIILEISLFDKKLTSTTVPDLVALPATGVLTAKVQGLGGDLDLGNFSLETDKDKLWGVGAQPVTIN